MAKVVPGRFTAEYVTVLSEWLGRIADAGFDGVELWERHATAVPREEVDRITAGGVPVGVLNTYASWDDPDPAFRDDAARWARRLGADAVKFNIGNDPAARGGYVERLQRFHDSVHDGARLLCECHAGTLAEDPRRAAAMFDDVAPPDRLQAIIHLGRTPGRDEAEFMEVLGTRVGHVHLQLPDGSCSSTSGPSNPWERSSSTERGPSSSLRARRSRVAKSRM